MTTLTIGRDKTCDIIVDDNTVSRRHAELELCEDGGYRLVDLNSRNGTFILVGRRFVRATQAIVGVDDQIKLSTVKATVRDLLALAETRVDKRASRRGVDRTDILGPSLVDYDSVEVRLGRVVEGRWPAHFTFGLVAFFNAAAWAGITVAIIQIL